MTTATFTRTVHGQDAPVPGAYSIDPAHTGVNFQVQHMGISKVRGHFTDVAGTITVGETAADSSTGVTIQTHSIDTAHPQRDEHLRTSDFLDVTNHPTVHFRSGSIEPDGDKWKIRGELTILGNTRPVTLDAEFEGAGPDVLGDAEQPRVGFSAKTKIDREDFDLTYNQLLETGHWMLGKQIKIELDVEAVRQ